MFEDIIHVVIVSDLELLLICRTE